ncbi:hypothetical protein F5X96DRAFT_617766 [Biscogniauxia mediterranea]|nr:hypothetical protein F5X96DRAFT_617766 [Biscogniauxia mediterranea]
MVVRTPPVLSLRRGFLLQIHQPLPLSRRESRQLLESITTSFRKNLDKEHPWQQQDETAPPSSASANAQPSSSTLMSSGAAGTRHHRPTDSHLRAILTNPLFSHTHDAQPTDPRKPFDVFDSAVSRGLMTPRRAAGFLATVRAQIAKESAAGDVRKRMGESGAALRVVQWLRASGQEGSMNFLADDFLVKIIVPFMYAEGLEDLLWVWLARLAARITDLELEKRPGVVNAQSLARLLSVVVREPAFSGTAEAKISLDGSYSALFKARDILSVPNRLAARIVKSSWAFLSWESTVKAGTRPKPSAPLFDTFLDVGRPFKLALDLAHLDLHHPTTPRHSAAFEYLRLENQTQTQGGIAAGERRSRHSQMRIICLAQDTADRLKQVGRPEEASWVERFLARSYEGLMSNVPGIGSLGSDASLGRSL